MRRLSSSAAADPTRSRPAGAIRRRASTTHDAPPAACRGGGDGGQVPLKLERTVTAGMLVCADSFLFNFTLLPLRAASAALCLPRALLAGGRLPRSAPGAAARSERRDGEDGEGKEMREREDGEGKGIQAEGGKQGKEVRAGNKEGRQGTCWRCR